MTDPRQQSAQREHAIDVTVLAMTDGRHFLTVADQRRVAGKYLDRILAECPALFAAQPPQGETREPVAYARERRFPGRTGWEFERVDRDPKDAELHTLPHYEYRTLPLFAPERVEGVINGSDIGADIRGAGERETLAELEAIETDLTLLGDVTRGDIQDRVDSIRARVAALIERAHTQEP
jgi:hypothetical protein